ncbi:organic cation transporter protein-like [Nomia melanderi]|uniref:organic cation transporter protein-like n=1 Tax=Nomia melanderi TaxID=2448451 RepID=UPI003FCCE895
MSEGSMKAKVADPLLVALDRLGCGSNFLWIIFIFTLTPTIFNGMHSMSYIFIAEIGFEKALEYKNNNSLPEEIACAERSFAHDLDGTSFVEDWDLVCDKTAARSSTHMALSLGKLLGSAFFGVFADKYGRKVSYVIVTEVANEKHRQWMGIAYNIGYASGIVIIPGVAYFLHEWRHVQWAISLPALLLLIPLW